VFYGRKECLSRASILRRSLLRGAAGVILPASKGPARAADLALPHERRTINRLISPCQNIIDSIKAHQSTFVSHQNTNSKLKHKQHYQINMPTLVKSTAYKSIFDTTEGTNPDSTQTNASSSAQDNQDPYTSTRKPDLDPEVSSVFTQSTLAPSETQGADSSSSSSRFGFLHRKKSPQPQETLLETAEKKEKKKSRFENPFKPHVQTDEDRAIMERMRERLQSKEAAIRQGGAQPAGWKGVGGGQEMSMPWSVVM
jgi:hypothetical protein